MKSKFRIWRLSNSLAVFLIVALLGLTAPAGAAPAGTKFELVKTIISPTPTERGLFGESAAAVGDKFLIGEPGPCPAPGAVHLFDSDGNPVRTISAPTISCFGWDVGGVDADLLVGAFLDSTAGDIAGAAYLFDDATGDLLQTFLNPNPDKDFAFGHDFFGWRVAGMGNNVLVAAPEEDIGTLDAGVVYVFDTATGGLSRTIPNPTPEVGDRFGAEIAVVGNNIAISAFQGAELFNGGAVYLFDASGNLLTTISSPRPVEGGDFGISMAAFGDNLLVGEDAGFSGEVQSGVAHLFDSTTGALIRSYFNPTPELFEAFGFSVAASGSLVVVGSLRDHKAKSVPGAAYVFDGTTGDLMDKFVNPEPSLRDSYAFEVAALGERVLVMSPLQSSDPGTNLRDGVGYLFQPKRTR